MLNVACVGAGYFSRFHFDGWQRIAQTQIVGVTNRDRAKAEATGLPVFDTLEQMLEETRPDILDVITAPEGHAEAIRAGLGAGVQAIICQKPFCTSSEEARKITRLAESAGIPLIVHENFRWQPWYREIRAQMAKGAIGTPQQGTFRLRPGDGQGPDAYLARQPYFQTMPRFLIHETGVHWIDTFRFLFGEPVAVYADLRKVNPAIAGEDAGLFTLDHADGQRSFFDGNRCLDHAAENTRCTMGEGLFEGSEGSLSLLGDGSVHLRSFGHQESREILGPNQSPNFGGDCTHALQAHVVRGLTDGDGFENVARDYLRILEIEAAIYRSAESGQKIALSAP